MGKIAVGLCLTMLLSGLCWADSCTVTVHMPEMGMEKYILAISPLRNIFQVGGKSFDFGSSVTTSWDGVTGEKARLAPAALVNPNQEASLSLALLKVKEQLSNMQISAGEVELRAYAIACPVPAI